ncbi:hypothetical protein GCM10011335_35180 [Aureimonas glaciei]|uniref:Uncharacterized protein n=1 Tax=Aureimonas glaciei TaxID=1776957 RepID=A0A916Y388_9HYPH|nr:hypothetical protein GCM10011335_35180 [Aureimonas glaciei]
MWTREEVSRLRKHFAVAHLRELESLVGRPLNSIRAKADKLGLRRPQQTYTPTGNALLDSLRGRCRELCYTMVDLDEMVVSGTYFKDCGWNSPGTKQGRLKQYFSFTRIAKGIHVIGGTLDVVWDEG